MSSAVKNDETMSSTTANSVANNKGAPVAGSDLHSQESKCVSGSLLVSKQRCENSKERAWDDACGDLVIAGTLAGSLPKDILSRIFGYLVTPDFPAAALVCKSWASVVNEGMDGLIIVSDAVRRKDTSINPMLAYSTKHNRWQILDDHDDDSKLTVSKVCKAEIIRQGRFIYALFPDPHEDPDEEPDEGPHDGHVTTMRYDPYTHGSGWSALDFTAKYRTKFRLATSGKSLYVIGGDWSYTTPQVCDLSLKVPTWNKLPQLLHALGGWESSSAALDGKIYAIGGLKLANATDITPDPSVSRYVPETASWETVAPLVIGRFLLETCTVCGCIYAIGGLSQRLGGDSYFPELTIERYSPVSNNWEVVTSMPTRRTLFSIAVVGKKIYIIGGKILNLQERFSFSGGDGTNLVEIFDTESKMWTVGTPLPDQQTPCTYKACTSYAWFG